SAAAMESVRAFFPDMVIFCHLTKNCPAIVVAAKPHPAVALFVPPPMAKARSMLTIYEKRICAHVRTKTTLKIDLSHRGEKRPKALMARSLRNAIPHHYCARPAIIRPHRPPT